QIPYAIVGAMALFIHGFRRFTEAVDLLVTRESMDHLIQELEGLGYVQPRGTTTKLRDTRTGVRIEFLISGGFPGDGKPKPVVFPDPASDTINVEGLKVLGLPSLINLKLASGIAAVCLWAATYFHSRWSQAILYFAAAAGIQLRLLCNLLDGLVAVEHAKATRSGEIYNDLPDRLSDMLILIMAGYSAAALGIRFAHELGWIAASLAVLTAYARVLGRSIGSGIYFIGPMAKQHRMALMTSG